MHLGVAWRRDQCGAVQCMNMLCWGAECARLPKVVFDCQTVRHVLWSLCIQQQRRCGLPTKWAVPGQAHTSPVRVGSNPELFCNACCIFEQLVTGEQELNTSTSKSFHQIDCLRSPCPGNVDRGATLGNVTEESAVKGLLTCKQTASGICCRDITWQY